MEKKRQRQWEEEARGAVLQEALRGSGLSIYSNDNNNLCRLYIRWGYGDPNQIANVIKERGFYKRFTRYSEIYRNSMVALTQYESYILDESNRYHWDYQYSATAQNQALEEWVRAFPTRDAALADPNLPESLKEKVRQIGVNE
jgi:Ni/Co efflux regulator RcnB